MTEAARRLLRDLAQEPKPAPTDAATTADPDADPLFGLWQDYADEMDEIVADAYRRRRESKWREFDL